MAERLTDANGVELCTESFGDSADAPILLVMGIGGQMLHTTRADGLANDDARPPA